MGWGPRGYFGVIVGYQPREDAVLQVGQLFEEGVRRAQSSDSSRRAFSVYSSSRAPGRYAPSYTPRSALSPGHLLVTPRTTLSPLWYLLHLPHEILCVPRLSQCCLTTLKSLGHPRVLRMSQYPLVIPMCPSHLHVPPSQSQYPLMIPCACVS